MILQDLPYDLKCILVRSSPEWRFTCKEFRRIDNDVYKTRAIQGLGLDIINEFYESKFGYLWEQYLIAKDIYTEVSLQTCTTEELIDDTWGYLYKKLQRPFLLLDKKFFTIFQHDIYEFYNDDNNENSIGKRTHLNNINKNKLMDYNPGYGVKIDSAYNVFGQIKIRLFPDKYLILLTFKHETSKSHSFSPLKISIKDSTTHQELGSCYTRNVESNFLSNYILGMRDIPSLNPNPIPDTIPNGIVDLIHLNNERSEADYINTWRRITLTIEERGYARKQDLSLYHFKLIPISTIPTNNLSNMKLQISSRKTFNEKFGDMDLSFPLKKKLDDQAQSPFMIKETIDLYRAIQEILGT